MKKLVSSSEAAKILGLSLQGIHYRIKKGQLESIKKDGKTFVYVDGKAESKLNITSNQELTQGSLLALKSKDEQIVLLKKTIKYIKKQHDKELLRLDNTQNKILDVFKSEVDLLKSAFSEMKNIYQLEKKDEEVQCEQENETDIVIENNSSNITALDLSNFKKTNKDKYISIKGFFELLKKCDNTEDDIKNIVIEKIKAKDKRFHYDQCSSEIKILNSDFLDII